MSARIQGLWPFLTVFPGQKQEAESEVGQPTLEPVPMWDADTTDGRLAYYASMLDSQISLL